MINWIVLAALHLRHIEKESPLFTDGKGRDKSLCVFLCAFQRESLLQASETVSAFMRRQSGHGDEKTL